MSVFVHRFEPRPDDSVEIEFSQGNYGYTGNWIRYRVRKTAGRPVVEFLSSALDE